jgi:hypothetical protein
MKEAPENGKETLNYAHANGMNELTSEAVFQQPKETTL